jgi:shikimate dehydrogenase/3-dehydroquinate dehydratase type I
LSMEIIASFAFDSRSDPVEELCHPPAAATMVELRADLLPAGIDLAALVAASPLPVVLTLRSRSEGGGGPDDAAARASFFSRWVGLPVAFFDLEAARDTELTGKALPQERTILSAHFPAGVPADLEERAKACLATGARLVKLVPTARTVDDAITVLALARGLERGNPESRRGIVFAAGETGRATRLLGPLLGAPIAYAAWESHRAAAEGQYDTEELVALIGHLGGRPRHLFAVLGRPAGPSLSPRMHAAAYRALGLPNLFVPVEVGDEAELDRLIAPLGSSCFDELGLPLGGLAVTMPWKEEAARRCDVLAPRAERAGAVNTVIPRAGKTLGDCTDIDGITGVLRHAALEVAGRDALVLGTGGAARAAAVALDLVGARVAVAGRDPHRAQTLAARLGLSVAAVGDSARAVVVVNATPAGSAGEASEWLEALRMAEGAAVVDLPYGEGVTTLERLAAERGWRYVGGREVLLFQGIAQFAAMNQVAPPVRGMAAALGLEEIQG